MSPHPREPLVYASQVVDRQAAELGLQGDLATLVTRAIAAGHGSFSVRDGVKGGLVRLPDDLGRVVHRTSSRSGSGRRAWRVVDVFELVEPQPRRHGRGAHGRPADDVEKAAAP